MQHTVYDSSKSLCAHKIVLSSSLVALKYYYIYLPIAVAYCTTRYTILFYFKYNDTKRVPFEWRAHTRLPIISLLLHNMKYYILFCPYCLRIFNTSNILIGGFVTGRPRARISFFNSHLRFRYACANRRSSRSFFKTDRVRARFLTRNFFFAFARPAQYVRVLYYIYTHAHAFIFIRLCTAVNRSCKKIFQNRLYRVFSTVYRPRTQLGQHTHTHDVDLYIYIHMDSTVVSANFFTLQVKQYILLFVCV